MTKSKSMSLEEAVAKPVRSRPMKPTVQECLDASKAQLDVYQKTLSRTEYLDALVRLGDDVSDRIEGVHEQIMKERHRDG